MNKTPPRKREVKPLSCFSDLPLPKKFLSGDIALSQSLMTMAMQCDRQFIYATNRFEVAGKESNTFFGTCCHELMDVFYTLGEKPDDAMLSEALDEFLANEEAKGHLNWLSLSDRAYYETIIVNTMAEYFNFYEADFDYKFLELENVFKVPYNGIWLTGKKDGVVEIDGKKYLFEHKTKGMINEEQIKLNLDINFQTQFYMLAHRIQHRYKLDGVLYNIIRRTKAKPKGGESLKKFGERLRQEIQNDFGYFFLRYTCEYSQKQIDEFESELEEKVKRLVQLIKGERRPLKNEAFCVGNFECPFHRACALNTLEGYRQRTVVSPELE